MPTKKPRKNIIPDNLPAVTKPEEFVPSLFTGQQLADKDPIKYGKIVQGLGEGRALTRIKKENKVSAETIMAISKRESKTIDAVQDLTQGLTSYASQACLMRIIEKLEQDKIPPGVLPIAFGVLRDKEKADLGQASSIVEHKKAVTIEDVQRELQSIKSEVIDITPEPGEGQANQGA